MSHATVLVIGDDVEEQMAPFDENISVEPYKERITFDPEGWPGRFIAKEAPDLDLTDIAACVAWCRAHAKEMGERYELDEQGAYQWSTYNPLSKWDWYQIGGRWQGMLLLKPGAVGQVGEQSWAGGTERGGVDRARKGDIDWDAMRAATVAQVESRWDEYEKALAKGNMNEATASFMYGIEEGQTRQSQLNAVKTSFPLHAYAVLAEGNWREPGPMGWWGVSHADESDNLAYDEWFSRFMDSLPDEAWLTIVDYHI